MANFPPESQRGLLDLIRSYLRNSQKDETNREKYKNLGTEKIHIEHIFPRQWKHYDGWTE